MRQLILILLVHFSFAAHAQLFVPSEIALQPKKQQLMLMVTDAVEGMPDSQYYWTGLPLTQVLSSTGTGLQLLGYSQLPNGFDLKLSQNGGQYQFLGGDNMTITPIGNKFYFSANIPALTWNGISGIPPDLADGDDNTTYTANNGIEIAANGRIQMKVDGLSLENNPVLDDYFPFFDKNQNTENRMTFDVLKNLIDTDTDTKLTSEQVQDAVGQMLSGNTESNISVVYDDPNNKINFTATGGTQTSAFNIYDYGLTTAYANSDRFVLARGDGNHRAMTFATLKSFIDTDTKLSSSEVQNIVGNMFSGNIENGITATYQSGKINLTVTGGSGGSDDGNGIFSSGGTAAGSLNMNSNSISNFGSLSTTTFGGILSTKYTIVPSLNNLEIRLNTGQRYIFNNTGTPTADDHVATKKYVDDNSGGGSSGIAYSTTEQLTADTDTEGNPIYLNTFKVSIIESGTTHTFNFPASYNIKRQDWGFKRALTTWNGSGHINTSFTDPLQTAYIYKTNSSSAALKITNNTNFNISEVELNVWYTK